MFHTTYAYGHDFGNTETTGYTQTRAGDATLTLSSALHRGSYEELMRLVGATSSNDGEISILNPQSHTLKFRDLEGHERELFVGELAIKQAGNTTMDVLTGRGQMQRYWDYRSLALTLTTSGTLISDTDYGLAVVSNIPVASHTETNVKRVKAALEGHFDFILDGRKRSAHITVKKTIMEGASVNILYGDKKSKIGVVDIGGRTTDVYMIDGLAPVQDQCKSFDIGIETASDRVKNRFEEQFDYPISVNDTRSLMSAYLTSKRYQDIPSVANAGVSDPFAERLVHQILHEVGQDIVNRIRGAWNQSFKSGAVAGDVSSIFGIGGGAYYFESELTELFKRRLIVPKHPERINAYGCFHLAKHYLQRDAAVTKVVG
jgi:hypothetical protein